MSDEPIPAPVSVEPPAPEPVPAPPAPEPPKPDGDGQTPKGDAKPAEPVVPEKYDLKPPEGVTFAPESLAAFEKEAKALKMTQEDAQAYLNARFESVKAEREASEKAQVEAFKATNEGWINELKADPDFGGANFEKSQSRINAVREKYGNEATKELFEQIGNHPGLCKMLAAMGADLEQDHFVKGNTPPKQEAGPKVMYANSPELK